MRKLATLLALMALLAVIAGPADAKKKASAKPVKVFEDPAEDANNLGALPASVPGGFDLVSGTIQQKGKGLEFVVTHGDMPPTGSIGEGFRLIWGVAVDGTQYEMTIKSFDIGKPDVIASAMGQDPNGEERVGQVYQGVARFEECGTISLGINWSQCTALGYYEAIFDPATMTATWTIPLDVMKAKKGSEIAGGGGGRATTGCQICWVPQYAERSLTPTSIIDAATQTITFKVR
jgi:hypothetical protein